MKQKFTHNIAIQARKLNSLRVFFNACFSFQSAFNGMYMVNLMDTDAADKI